MRYRAVVSKSSPFPVTLRYTDVRSYLLTVLFVLCDILVPRLFHQFYLAGPTFLPMHIFTLMAGLMFGWRAGLIVGLFTPLGSYAMSVMPTVNILPQTVVELAVYGLVSGILREKLNLRVMWSLLGAMIAGRLALGLAAMVVYLIAGKSESFLGFEANPFMVIWSAVSQGWPGIVIQLVLIPVVIRLITGLLLATKREVET